MSSCSQNGFDPIYFCYYYKLVVTSASLWLEANIVEQLVDLGCERFRRDQF